MKVRATGEKMPKGVSGAGKRILPGSSRESGTYGIFENVSDRILDCVARPQDVVVVALLP